MSTAAHDVTETPEQAARRLSASARRKGYIPEALHVYRDDAGTPIYYRIRCRHPDGRKWIRPMHWDGSAYVLVEPPALASSKPLYRLCELMASDTDEPVLIVEGEWCADHAARLGLTVTTSGHASSGSVTDWLPLRGRQCVIWPDHDDAGRKYADDVTTILHRMGCVVERIDVAALGLDDGGDIVDWLAVHPDATAADVLALPRVPDVTPEAAELRLQPERAVLVRGDCITPEPIIWLWPDWIAAGKLHILAGAPGTGKTTLALALAAAVTCGGLWPDRTRATAGDVVMWSGEDSPEDVLIPRALAMGADTSRLHIVRGIAGPDGTRPYDPATDTAALAEAMRSLPDVRLLIVDPIVSAVSGDSHHNAETRRSLQPLVDLAQAHSCALVGITHLSKGTAGRDPIERVTGSLAFGALARVVLMAVREQAEDGQAGRRLLLRAKSNIGPDTGGYVYDLRQDELAGYPGVIASSVRWGEAVEGTARALMAAAEQVDEDHSGDAADYLRDLLAAGPMSPRDVRRQADDAGYAWRTVQRAMRRAGVVSQRSGFGGGATWSLAPSTAPTAPFAPFTPASECGADGANGDTVARMGADGMDL